jgi:hypothetical protein
MALSFHAFAPPDPSPQRVEELAAMMAKRMGAVPDQRGAAFGTTDEDRTVELLVSKMGGAAEQRRSV